MMFELDNLYVFILVFGVLCLLGYVCYDKICVILFIDYNRINIEFSVINLIY